MPWSEKGRACDLEAILVILHWTKPIFNHGQAIEKSNPYIKFGRNWGDD